MPEVVICKVRADGSGFIEFREVENLNEYWKAEDGKLLDRIESGLIIVKVIDEKGNEIPSKILLNVPKYLSKF